MFIKPFQARYAKYVEAEIKTAIFVTQMDASERTQKDSPDVRLVPSELYDANEAGESWVFTVSPTDNPHEVVRQVLAAFGLKQKPVKKAS